MKIRQIVIAGAVAMLLATTPAWSRSGKTVTMAKEINARGIVAVAG